MNIKTLSIGLTLAFTLVLAGLALSQQDKGKVMEVAEKQPVEPKEKIVKTDEEWKKELTSDQYRILRKAGTERAFGPVYQEFAKQGEGSYVCVGCHAELFTSNEKFDSHSGWPSFYDVAKTDNIKTARDEKFGMVRVEVLCAKCDGHLGHLFEGEGRDTPTDQRYCINGTVLQFVPKEVKSAAAEVEEPAGEEKK